MTPRRVSVVPHTHWDREWYAPFQAFRMRLVDLLDEFLDHLEGDPSYAHFMLDGQMAVIDDYLEIRPEAGERLGALAASGRLAVGPWYILMDEFLVSGETIWRNLQMGIKRAADFGGAMAVGYLPDMFGHVAQMPQILRHAGLGQAVVWRGVPAAVDRTGFWWESPDGSEVRAEYLPEGYGNGAGLPQDATALIERVSAHAHDIADLLGDGPLLLMNGTDHQTPQPWLGMVVAAANEAQDQFQFTVCSLADHLAHAPTDGLPRWKGELRSGHRANLLMGVASNRTDVKQAAARVERDLERLAEPLAALYLPEWPEALLTHAWRDVVRNSAHDSICACSHDDVVRAVLHRYAEANAIAAGVSRRATRSLGRSLATAGVYAINPSARTRAGLIEVEVDGDAELDGAQLLSQRPQTLFDITTTAADLPSFLNLVRSQQIDESTFITSVDIDDQPDALTVRLQAEDRLRSNLLVEQLKTDVRARADRAPDRPVRLLVEQRATKRVLAWAGPVPGFGWARWEGDDPGIAPATASDAVLANGLVRVEVDPSDGTLSINGQAGFDRLVDGGDHGDTYNYSPPDHDVTIDRPTSVSVSVVEAGPLRARLKVVRAFAWPEGIDDEARSRVGERETVVTSVLEVVAGRPWVSVVTTFENSCRDHRLRSHLPLPSPALSSRAECAFAIVERGLTAEGGPTERALATYPSRRFVQAGGLTVAHEGLLEYELVDVEGGRARTLALTLLRSTGMLSRVEMAYRPLPAGPPDVLRGPQSLGPVEARYAISVDPGVDPYAMVDDVFLPLLSIRAEGGGQRQNRGTGLVVTGAEVSAVRRQDGVLEVRVFNPSDRAADFEISGSGFFTDLRGEQTESFSGKGQLDPWAIATIRLTDVLSSTS